MRFIKFLLDRTAAGGRDSRGLGLTLAGAALAVLVATPAAAERPCANTAAGLGVERIIEIDTSTGAHFGDHTKRPKEPTFLKPKEVVLTFDDGPMPGLTKQILDTLDTHCTRATWFAVGRMAVAFPELTREILRRGHTLGTHTWSHPLNLPRLKHESAVTEIEKGFAAISVAAGQPVAPFFRFPGLNDSNALLAHLQARGISAFTVDVISDDSFISSTERLIETTLRRVEARNGGILLFHDIKATTARALPTILASLKARGYKIVHLVAKTNVEPLVDQIAAVTPLLAKFEGGKTGAKLATDAEAPPAVVPGSNAIALANPPVDVVAPPARSFAVAAVDVGSGGAKPRRPRVRADRPPALRPSQDPSTNWATTYRRPRRVSTAE